MNLTIWIERTTSYLFFRHPQRWGMLNLSFDWLYFKGLPLLVKIVKKNAKRISCFYKTDKFMTLMSMLKGNLDMNKIYLEK